MRYGYVRATKGALKAAEQRQALRVAQCDECAEEDGGAKDRPTLQGLIEKLQSGDALVVASFDRLAPSLPLLLAVMAKLTSKGVHVSGLEDSVDTQATGSKLEDVSQMLRGLLAAERGFLIERVQEGRANAVRSGVKLGRRHKLTTDQVQHAKRLLDLGEGGRLVARTFGVSEATLYRYIRNLKSAQGHRISDNV